MQFMDNTRGDKLNKYRATVQLGADHSAYTDALPSTGVAIGTVTIREHSGALVYLEHIGGYIMITPNRVHRLNDHKTAAAIVQAAQDQQLDLATCSAVIREAIERAQIEDQQFQQQRHEKRELDRQRETERQRQLKAKQQ